MEKQTKTLNEKIEKWRYKMEETGFITIDKKYGKEIKSHVKEFIKKLLTPNNISKGFVEISEIKYHAGDDLI